MGRRDWTTLNLGLSDIGGVVVAPDGDMSL